MKFIRLFYFIILFVLVNSNQIYSQAFKYLSVRPGIKSNAMGGAQTAIANDYLSFYYNPAGLSRAQKALAGYSNTSYKLFDKFENRLPFGGVAVNLKIGVIGFNGYFYSHEEVVKQRSYQLSFARRVSDNFRFGLTLKYLKNVTGPGSAYSGDIGTIFENILPQITFNLWDSKSIEFTKQFKKPGFRGLAIGLSLLNTGPDKIEYSPGITEALPQMLNLGLGYKVIESDLLNTILAIDLNKILVRRRGDEDDNFFKAWFSSWEKSGWDSIHFGLDLNFYHLVSLFLGYEHYFNITNETKGGTSIGFSVGPDYAHLEVYYRVYPIYLPDNPEREWRFGLSLSY